MLTLKLKLVVLLIGSVNFILIPNLPPIEISISPSPSLSFLSEACSPDISMIFDKSPIEIPKAFETCRNEISAVAGEIHPDANKTTGEVIKSYGYPLEIHKVTTKDGYILTVHRIPKNGGVPVYLQHGLGGTSDNWILQYRNKSLAFLLADNGYDVWLANSRGTTYSLEHESLKWDDPSDYSYWDFSWHEIGVYDIPAITNYIIAVTGMPKIVYIGHSMGTTTYLVALDQVPDLNDKILAGILLAPAGFVSRVASPMRALAELMGASPVYLEPIFKGRMDFQRKADMLQQLLNRTKADICTPTAIRCTACDQFIYSFYGINAPQTNYTNIPNNMAKFPNMVSVKTAYHFGQSVHKCSFRQFDYGFMKNIQVYNKSVPPDYTLKNIRAPTYSFYGHFDNMCRPKDVKRTLDLLPEGTLRENIPVNSTYFTHIDFLLAKDALTLVYTKVLTILDNIA